MSRASQIARHGKAYTFKRRSPGAHVNGRYVPNATEADVALVASVQTISGREREMLPEGERAREIRQVFTATEIRTSSETNEPDRVDLDGDGAIWEVFMVERHEAFGEVHYRALVHR